MSVLGQGLSFLPIVGCQAEVREVVFGGWRSLAKARQQSMEIGTRRREVPVNPRSARLYAFCRKEGYNSLALYEFERSSE